MDYYPGSGSALTLGEAADQLAYCYHCQSCGFKERINLTRVAADYPPEAQVGDLLKLLPCGQCGDTNKIVMLLWLSSTTTSSMLSERGFPVWEGDNS
jgi:hypothetical protein